LKVDDEKLLKRIARFGTVSVDAKKQKRAERFGGKTDKSVIVPGSAAIDEQKRKRAERFGLS